MVKGLAWLSKAMSYAVQGHQDGRVRAASSDKMVLWKREWQTTPVFLLQEPHEQYERGKKKKRTPEDKPPRSEGIQCATGEKQRAITSSSSKHEGAEPKQKWNSVVNMSGGESKVRCWLQQCCIGTWNVTSVNQGKSNVVKQEMARVNINILGISELIWIVIGEFNSDDHYIYYCGQDYLRRNGAALRINKRVQNAVLEYNLKNSRMISVHFQGKPLNTVIQIYVPSNH